jgi:hypothetical protein
MINITFYSNDLRKELDVEAIYPKKDTFAVRVDGVMHVLDGADKLFDRIRAEARAEAARDLPEYGWQKRFRETYGIPWDRALSNREAQLHDACKLGWELARAAILADGPKEERGAEVGEPNADEYEYKGAIHQRVAGIWFRIEGGRIVDRDQYRHDIESRVERRIEASRS